MSEALPPDNAAPRARSRLRVTLAMLYWWLRRTVVTPVFNEIVILLFRLRLLAKSGWRGMPTCVVINGVRIGPLVERADGALRYKSRTGKDGETWYGVVQEICNPALGRIIEGRLPLIVAPTVYRSLVGRRSRTGANPSFVFERLFDQYPDLFEGTQATLELPSDFAERAREALFRRYGLASGTRFIAFHARDEGYLTQHQPGQNWGYHSYRNSLIDTYFMAIEKVVAADLTALRIGAKSSQKVPADWGPAVIDYANDGADQMLDVLISACAEFAMIGGGSGIGHVAQAFGRPVIWTNFIPANPWPWCADDLFVPKLLRRRTTGRLLTFAELKELGYFPPGAPLYTTAHFDDLGLDVVDNSPEDIAGAAEEMLARLRGEPPIPELAELQREFRQRYKPGRPNGGNISANFLTRHRDLL